MPFKSERQRRFVWAKHPEIAEAWTEEARKAMKMGPLDRVVSRARTKRAPKRVSRKEGVVYEHAATELQLFIENDGALYPRRQLIRRNMEKKLASKTYDKTKAFKAYLYLVDEGAKKHIREYGSPSAMFNAPTRRSVAKSLAENDYAEYRITHARRR